MAIYYTEFSFEIDNVTDEEANWLLRAEEVLHDFDVPDKLTAEDLAEYSTVREPGTYYFGFSVLRDADTVFITDLDGEGDIELVADLMAAFLRKFRPDERIGFTWCARCDKPRPDSFSGGAVLITADGPEYWSAEQWLAERMSA